MAGAMALLTFGATAASASPLGDIKHPGTPVSMGPVSPAPNPQPQVHSAAFANRGVLNFGDAVYYGSPTNVSLAAPVVGMAASHDGQGYWLAAADGGVFNDGDAGFFGSAGDVNLNAPIVGMAATPDGQGYWLVATDGGIFNFGDAGFYGSLGNIRLNQPIVAMAATPDGHGYWLVASDGGVFEFGDASFYGSLGNIRLNAPIVGMAASPHGSGYWLVAGDGGVFNFGAAPFEGSAGNQDISASVAGMAATPEGEGYWLAGSDGSIYTFGDAVGHGDNTSVGPEAPISSIATTPDGGGYWLLEPDAFPTAFSHPPAPSAIVDNAATQIEADPDAGLGQFCNPYGPCEEWCALFATWAWESAGFGIPRYAFVGDIYNWAAANTAVLSPGVAPQPGDLVLYGTGPQNVDTAVHVGIVAQRWRDGFIDTIEGDSGPGPFGAYSVTINGPFLPADSLDYNGVGIFAYAVP